MSYINKLLIVVYGLIMVVNVYSVVKYHSVMVSLLEIGQHGTLTFNDNIYLGPMVRVACYDSVIMVQIVV